MIRSILCAVAVSIPLVLVPGTAVAQPGTVACKEAKDAVTIAQGIRDDAKEALDVIPVSPPSQERTNAEKALADAEFTLNARKDAQAKACAEPAPTTTPRPDRPIRSCGDLQDAGVALPVHRGSKHYRGFLDRDHDGLACEEDERDRDRPGRGPIIVEGDCTVLIGRRDAEKAALREAIRRINERHDGYRSRARDYRLNPVEADELRGYYGEYDRRASSWRRLDTDRRLVCRDNRPDVIEVRINEAPEPVRQSVPCACTAPSSSSGGQVYATPRGAAETGSL